MARKRQLLDVLRERENRAAEAHPQAGHSSGHSLDRPRFPFPPQALPIAMGVLLLALLLWAGCTFLGGPGEDAQAEGNGSLNSPVVGQTYGVLAVTYDPSREDQAKKEGRSLVALGYAVQLVEVEGSSGSLELQLFVGSASRASELESLLQEIRAMSREGRPALFAGASIRPMPIPQ